jgi:glycogenin glucosyltransferase
VGRITVYETRLLSVVAELTDPRAPPPSGAKPEAANFPTTQYEMSEDKSLFQAPNKYPEPPKDMYYQVPETKPQPEARPPPIFPWEARQAKPTRVFPRAPPPPEPEPEPVAAAAAAAASVADTEVSAPDDAMPSTPTIAVTPADPWTAYTRTNAWDEMPDIERYIQAVQASRKGKVQVLINAEATGKDVLSPDSAKATERRPSFKVTDFPTEVERPSLPVTPAPVRRPSFWGEERDELGQLPAAEGVPKQEEWVCPLCKQSIPVPPQQLVQQYQLYQQNPVQRLEELQRRQSAVLEQGAQPDPKELPKRDMPGSASAAEVGKAAERAAEKAAPPAFAEPAFTAPATRSSAEEEADPTSTVGTAVEASA